MTDLPYISDLNLKIGGEIKESAEDFIVEEIPLYLPSGEGQHIYLLIRKRELTTADIERELTSIFNISDKDIGYAGLKDKKAITTQWFSLSLGANYPIDEIKNLIEERIEGVEVLELGRHSNKLKIGHLKGNKFTLKISNTISSPLSISNKIIQELKQQGIPNFYGSQRFGSKGDNALIGKEVLLGKKKVKKRWLGKMYLSAYQSKLFNEWLSHRVQAGDFSTILEGDLLQNIEGGRTFQINDFNQSVEEFNNFIISYTGPIFGNKALSPSGTPQEIEEEILKREEVSLEDFKKSRLQGTRRIARLPLHDLEIIDSSEDSIQLSFSLPAGSYATIVAREFIKNT
ncbi:hypothetical protein BIY24_05655 [Halobacteriovorax marinus]|uniref:tRNA pseudouridine(13) synthase TruD n=1 Tax=Halobacteriovorax marinus TaxID=97084 RepID=UPI000BC2CB84|nr:tRNA pseudouridine(13) synthase TruD [Halobacteriovorax marinus]ATH07444.1 hypothetical protein BIY24_05655 [Halobacteriovorax marinus]